MADIKRMKEQDLAQVLEIEKECFASDAWSEDMFKYAVNTEGFCSLSAFADNGELAGYIIVTEFVDANIDSIAVKREYRRQGIAESLIEAALKGFSGDVFLEVRVSNTPAISLYEKLGFEKIALRKDYYDFPCEDAIIMKAERY